MNAPTGFPDQPSYSAVSARRVGAMVLRYLYLLRSSWPRLLELIYWPLLQMMMWGFLQTYLIERSSALVGAAGFLIGGVLLWDILFRGQLGFSISFLEEMWSRNLGNLMMSPLRPAEFLLALGTMSIVRLTLGIVPVSLLAIVFFGFNLWAMGLALAAFFANLLMTSWAVAIAVCGLILRNGLGAENLAWTLMFLLLPLTCVYYPVETLPPFLQSFAWMLPPTYVFEGMRAILLEGQFRGDLMVQAFLINAAAIAVASFLFFRLYASSRRAGKLLQIGE